MIVLNKNSSNNVVLTLAENATVTAATPYYLFRFIDYGTNNEIFFTGPNISTNVLRFDQFNIIVTGSSHQNLTASTISMNPDGEWKYEIYNMYSPTNLFLSGTTGDIIEYGLIQLSGTSNMNVINSYYTGQSQTYNYYVPS